MFHKIQQGLSNYLFSEERPLLERLFNLVCCFGVMAGLIGAIVTFAIDAPLLSALSTLLIAATSIVSMFLGNTLHNFRASSNVLLSVCGFVLFPIAYFTGGGIESGMTEFFILGLVLVFLLLKGRDCAIMVVFYLLSCTACMVVEYFYPETVIAFESRMMSFIDTIQSFIVSGIVLGVIVKLYVWVYERAKDKAEAASRAKDDFLASVSHEIRTPLNAIIGLSELELRKEHSAQTYDNFEKIYTSGYTLLSIINDILDISKIESGHFELVDAPYDVPGLINDAVRLNAVRIGSKPIIFKVEVDPQLPSKLFGDALRLKQILNNLLSNAFKYTQEGHVLLQIFWQPAEGMVRFVVSDTGVGIRKEDFDKLFAKYSQIDTKVNHHFEGTGLGLTICKNLVTMMGGTISVESDYQQGSKFSVLVPQQLVGQTKIGAKTARALMNFQYMTPHPTLYGAIDYQLPPGRVLIVDDVSTNLDVAQGMLAPYGLQIECVTRGAHAVERIRSGAEPYDLIFMDHMMPEMDGVETVRVIREEIGTAYAQKVPVIALTANAVVGTEEMFLKNGFQGFLSKPLDAMKLDKTLRTWIVDKELPSVARADACPKLTDMTVEGVNVKAGIARFQGREEQYLRVIQSFQKHMPSHLDKLSGHLASGAMQDYAIEVHGIKGSSYAIEATAVGKRAERLEMAAKQGDRTAVLAEHDALVAEMGALIEALSALPESVTS